MRLIEKANLIIYRIRQRGLEVFLVNNDLEGASEKWEIPQGSLDLSKNVVATSDDKLIELDAVNSPDSEEQQHAYAVEGDWHDIPSLKGLILEDVLFVKDKLKEFMPELEERGAFFAVKEAFKEVMPNQYAFLKELKDIISDRNSIKDL
jgi:hypothetical protein